MKNIIVLTSGLSGSSVLTHLISRAGYWAGDSTCKKADYNTYENSQLVYLNDLLLKTVDYDKDYSVVVKPEKVAEVEGLLTSIDLSPFQSFIADCDLSGPWVWKDPRLWVTMPFWVHLLPRAGFQVVFLDRSISQRWISELLRRNVQSVNYCSTYNSQIKTLIKHFVEKNQIPCCELLFDNLIERPESTLKLINDALALELEVDDLKAVYNKPLYKKARGFKSFIFSVLIYLKNYRSRLR